MTLTEINLLGASPKNLFDNYEVMDIVQELNGLLTIYINIPTVSTRTIQCSNFFHISRYIPGNKLL